MPVAVAKCRYHENCEGHGLGGFEATKTQQSHAQECDINEILKRARNGREITHLNARIAQYGDVSQVPDFHEAMNVVATAQSMFMELDANLRERFDNDPGKFLEFVQDVKNVDECEKLGILTKKQEKPKETNPSPVSVEPKPPVATPAEPAVVNPPAK